MAIGLKGEEEYKGEKRHERKEQNNRSTEKVKKNVFLRI
jgi:hypothetical protein